MFLKPIVLFGLHSLLLVEVQFGSTSVDAFQKSEFSWQKAIILLSLTECKCTGW